MRLRWREGIEAQEKGRPRSPCPRSGRARPGHGRRHHRGMRSVQRTHTGQAARPRLLIVDAHAYAYRAFHAIPARLRAPSGEPTHALYGFIRILGKLIQRHQPTHLAVIWDGGLAAQRVEAMPDYKTNRPPMPESLDRQITLMQTYLEAARIPSFCQEGVEADDWIATLAQQAAEAGFEVIIASGDKDFMQLVGPRIGLVNPLDKTERVWTEADVRAKTGLAPEQIVDWLSLIGDKVDNIPGVPGVGPGRATALLQRFGSIDELYARLEEVPSARLRESLRAAEPEVRRNRELIRLHPVEVPVDLDALKCQPPDRARLGELFRQWGFASLAAELERAQAPAQPTLL